MNTKRKNFEKYSKLSLRTLAVATSTLVLYYPAFAQEAGDKRPRRERSQREAGPVQPPSQFDEQAKAVLAKSAERYKSLRTWHVEQEIVSAGRFTKKISADFRAPRELIVTTNEAKGIKTVASYDAQKIITLRDFDNLLEYQLRPLAEEDDGQARAADQNPRQAFGSALGQYLSGFFNGDENVFGRQPVQTVKYSGTADLNGIAVDNITITSERRGQPVTITYSIGKQDSLVHKVVQTTRNADGASAEYVETYSNQKVDADLSDASFKLEIPATAVKVERFTQSRGIQTKIGDTPFAINAKDIEGKDISLEQYKGKVVLIDFWATWCGPCRAELPNLKAAYEKFKGQGFDVLGISQDQTKDPVKPFVTKESLGWRQVYDGYWNGPIAKAYNVRFIPSTILIGRDGKVAAVGVRGDSLEPAIRAALASQ